MRTKLSVNLNKVALIRNSRGSNLPDLVKVAQDCEAFGADGITLHPRPDERHAKYSDIPQMKKIVTTELNVEGYPSDKFMKMILEVKPDQCTLVPDPPGVLTSSSGWDTVQHERQLKDICDTLRATGIRSSLFVDPKIAMVEGAKKVGADRIELYTGPYAENYHSDRKKAISPYFQAAKVANDINLEINAGHDLNLENLHFFVKNIFWTAEVSIGHAIICDALYYGLHNVIQMYLHQLTKKD